MLQRVGLQKDYSHVVLPSKDDAWQHIAYLRELKDLLVADGATNFANTVTQAIDAMVASVEETGDSKHDFDLARRLFNGMWGGMGSLNDFYFVKGTPEQQAERSTRFDAVTGALHRFFQPEQAV